MKNAAQPSSDIAKTSGPQGNGWRASSSGISLISEHEVIENEKDHDAVDRHPQQDEDVRDVAGFHELREVH